VNGVALLGSTGNIGVQALDVMERCGIAPVALAARRNASLLEEQARRYRPALVTLENRQAGKALAIALADTPVKVRFGPEAAAEAAAHPAAGAVLNAMTGIAGLPPSLAALSAGKRLLLANKEALVAGGSLLRPREIIPVDSEHSAIFQCLRAGRKGLRRIILTASGGPFRSLSREALREASPEQAMRHPVWRMGPKVTADSALLINKGLELIEAMWLFGLPPERIDVLIHPQGTVHSLVEYADGALLAQLGTPDMRLPIQYALLYPRRAPSLAAPLDLALAEPLTFARPDMEAFGCLAAAYEAAKLGGSAGACYNAAAEVASRAFTQGKIPFPRVAELIFSALGAIHITASPDIGAIYAADGETRRFVEEKIK
jgi:1-deoxy-D-xylulose-5-phosphate reductoisomerase